MFKIIRSMLRLKNSQLGRIRERLAGSEQINKILSAYLALLIDDKGEVRVPKELISNTLDSYKADVKAVGDDYRITISRRPDKGGNVEK